MVGDCCEETMETISKWWSLYIYLLCCFFNPVSCLQNETDRLALISFKESIVLDPFGVLNSWNNSLQVCDWYGVVCSRRHPYRIIALNLRSQGLVGSLSPRIGNLSFLRHINFQNNSFHRQIPQQIGHLRRLRYINLSNNSFQGTIPSSLGNLSMLSVLNLDFNKLNGSIPPSLGSCKNLILLHLSHNSLSGSIPRQVMSLSSLSISFSLAGNKLSGHIPLEVGLLQNLAQLDLSDNKLSGWIPHFIGQCSSLEKLYLQGNSFEGRIPYVFNALQGLKQLDISRNNFSGPIPESLADLDDMYYLNLSFNQLQGQIPKHGVFLNASAVSLRNNSLCGGIAEFKIDSCPSPSSKKNSVSLATKVIIVVVVVLALLVPWTCFLIFCYRKIVPIENKISLESYDHQSPRITYVELFYGTNGFSTDNIIGVGGYGSVYKGILQQFGMEVAVKVLNMQRTGASKSFVLECQALRSIRHRNILKLLSVCSVMDSEGNDFKALIYEFMANGSLERWLHTNGGHKKLNLLQRLNIAIDIGIAIEYLHCGSSSKIIHGDLKPSNVLLDDDMTAHIGDFGLAEIVSAISCETQPYGIRGTVGYVAPEYGMGSPVSIEGDVYSYGILLLEMFTGKKPSSEEFKDGLNLHTFVKRHLHHGDVRLLSEIGTERYKDSIISVLRIGVACSMERPGDRMQMSDVLSLLAMVRSSYWTSNQRTAYRIEGPCNFQS